MSNPDQPMNPLTDPVRVRAALNSLGIRPSKSMGQNFLVDAAPLRQALDAAQVGPDDVIVEVGPGLGVLTWELLHAAGQVICVELDARLAERLRTEFAHEHLTLVQADVLDVPPTAMLQAANLPVDTPYKVVANIPYAITSPLLRHFLEADHPPTVLVVLMQWEVAERITAAAGKLSILAHSVQLYAEPQIISRVPAAAFIPPPAVDSALVLLRVRDRPAVDVPPEALFRVIKAGFSQARKKLLNSLSGGLAGQGLSKDQIAVALAATNIDGNLRAEALTLQQWADLAQELGFAAPSE